MAPEPDPDMPGCLPVGGDVDHRRNKRGVADERLHSFSMGDAVLQHHDVGVGIARRFEPTTHAERLMRFGAEQDQMERSGDRKRIGEYRHLGLDAFVAEVDDDLLERCAGGDSERHLVALQHGPGDSEADRARAEAYAAGRMPVADCPEFRGLLTALAGELVR